MSEQAPQLESLKSTSLQRVPSLSPPPVFTHKSTSTISVRLDTYRGINAFERKPFSCYEKFKCVLMVITGILLIRIILFMLIILLLYFFSLIVTCCNKDLRKPLSCWRKPFQYIMYLLVRIALFIAGFYWISTTNIKQFRTNKPRVIVANHHTIFDGFLLWWLCKGTAASKIESKYIPLAGRIADAFQTIWIDRIASDGRKKAIKQILNHVSDIKLPPLVIFPQGVCSEIGCITTFKKGAFLSGLPVQPIAIDWYWNTHADLSFVTTGVIFEIFYGMCQLINFVTIEFLSVHIPTEKETYDPLVYAEDVRQEIVNKLGVISTAHSLSDYILLKHSRGKNLKFDTSKFVMEDVTERLLFRTRTVTKLCDKYNELDKNNDGYIDYIEFCNAFKRDPNTNGMKNLFRLFNTKSNFNKNENELIAEYMDYEKIKNKKIGFEDFLVGVSVCFVDGMIQDGCRIMFDGINISKLSNEQNIIKKYVIDAYERSKDLNLHWNDNNNGIGSDNNNENKQEEEEKLNNDKYEIYDKEMDNFCRVMFKSDDEKIDFDTFYKRVLDNNQQACIHHFLQMIITFRLGIKLTEDDFIDETKITVKVGEELFRSQSLRK
eukprot:321724_1